MESVEKVFLKSMPEKETIAKMSSSTRLMTSTTSRAHFLLTLSRVLSAAFRMAFMRICTTLKTSLFHEMEAVLETTGEKVSFLKKSISSSFAC